MQLLKDMLIDIQIYVPLKRIISMMSSLEDLTG